MSASRKPLTSLLGTSPSPPIPADAMPDAPTTGI